MTEETTFLPSSTIILTAPDGRKATIDFGGERVTFSGDLSVDDAAKIFFENVGGHLLNALKRP